MSLSRSFIIVGLATLASRLTGFVRDILVAALLGAGAVADVFVAAFLLPNLFRKMMSEGALNVVLVPRLARLEEESGKGIAHIFANHLLAVVTSGVIVFVIFFEAFMPFLTSLIAHGFVKDATKFNDAVLFMRLSFPFIGFIMLAALVSALLNASEHYFIASITPLLLNLILIAALTFLMVFTPDEIRKIGLILVMVVSFAGGIQLITLLYAARKEGYRLRLWPKKLENAPKTRDVSTIFLLALPGMVIAGSGHIHLLIASQWASLEPKMMAHLYYADRLFQMPLGFVASAVGVVLLPRLAKALHRKDTPAMVEAMNETFLFISGLILPATIALFILASPIVSVLFMRGAFEASDAVASAEILRILALALPAFVLIKSILPIFLVRETIRWPLYYVSLAFVMNMVAAFVFRLWESGIAPAAGVVCGAWVNAFMLAWAARGQMMITPKTRQRLAGALVAVILMGVVLHFAVGWAASSLAIDQPFGVKAGALLLLCFGGLSLYLGVSYLLGVFTLRSIRKAFAKTEGSAKEE